MEQRDRNELTRWLQTATRGLSREVRDRVRVEIEAHYHHAIADHLAAGKGNDEAHRAALADLGEPQDTARALRGAYVSTARMFVALGLTLAFPFFFFALPLPLLALGLSSSEVALGISWNVHVFGTTAFVLLTFRRLVAQNHDAYPLNRWLAMSIWGLGIYTGAVAVSLLVFGIAAITQSETRVLWEASPLFQVVLDWVALSGVSAAGFGLIGAAGVLRRLESSLYGLRDLLAAALGLAGLAAIGFVLSLLFSAIASTTFIASMLSGLIFAFYSISLAVLALLFFRAVYRERRDPLQVA
jgi:hypothetical protein